MEKIKKVIIALVVFFTFLSISQLQNTILNKTEATENEYTAVREVTKGVIIHNDASTLEGSQYKYLESYNDDQLARGFAHYYVAAGDVYQFHDDSKVAWHSGNFSGNTEYVGVEATGSMRSEAEFLANEQEALKVAAEVLTKYGLEPNRDTVKLHREFYNTACPHRSWALHGQSINSVKDYFISQIKKYMQTTFKYKVGSSVEIRNIEGMSTVDGKAVPELDKNKTGTVEETQWMKHAVTGNYVKTYRVKAASGTTNLYVEWDLVAIPIKPTNYKFSVGNRVELINVSGMVTADGKVIPNTDKGRLGTIEEALWMKHSNSGNYVKVYRVKLENGTVGLYVEWDLANIPTKPQDYKYKVGNRVELINVSGMVTVDGKTVPNTDKSQVGTVQEVLWMKHANSGNYVKTYRVKLDNGVSGLYIEWDLVNTPAKPLDYKYSIGNRIELINVSGMSTVDGKTVPNTDKGQTGTIQETVWMKHANSNNYVKTYRVKLDNGTIGLYVEWDLMNIPEKPQDYKYVVGNRVKLINVAGMLTVDGKAVPSSDKSQSGTVQEILWMKHVISGTYVKTYKVKLDNGTIALYVEWDLQKK